MTNFETIWNRIKSREGQTFRQVRGGGFIYEVSGNTVIPDRTNQRFPKSQFEQAAALMPVDSTVPLQHLRGPSYLNAILTDRRIREFSW